MKGCLITFIGPSGVGKSEILNVIEERFPDLLTRAVSTTTRIVRDGEVEGRDFYFVDENVFHRKIAEGNFIEYNNYVGNYYGTSFDSIIPLIEDGKKVIKVIEVNGLKAVKDSEKMNGINHIAIFINAPSRDEREARIRGRGKLPEGEILARLKTGDDELAFYGDNVEYFDHYIINDNLDKAVEEVLEIIQKV